MSPSQRLWCCPRTTGKPKEPLSPISLVYVVKHFQQETVSVSTWAAVVGPNVLRRTFLRDQAVEHLDDEGGTGSAAQRRSLDSLGHP